MPRAPGDSAASDRRDRPGAGRSTVLAVLMALALVALVAAVQDGSAPEAALAVDESARRLSPRSGPVAGAGIETRSAGGASAGAPLDPDPAGVTSTADDPRAGQDGQAAPPTLFQELARADGVVYATDFTELGVEWEIYHSPGHAGLGLRRPSAVTAAPDPAAEGGSRLTITARMGTTGDELDQLVSGGLALRWPQTYGTYTFRLRVDRDPDEVTSGVAILWPWSNRWPQDGELDMVETYADRSTRTPVETNIHSLRPGAVAPFDRTDDRLLTVVHDGLDGSQWHVYRFDWRPEVLTLSIDGGEPIVITDDPQQIPDWDMVPTFQLDAFPAPSAPDRAPVLRGPVSLEVDWLIVEAAGQGPD